MGKNFDFCDLFAKAANGTRSSAKIKYAVTDQLGVPALLQLGRMAEVAGCY